MREQRSLWPRFQVDWPMDAPEVGDASPGTWTGTMTDYYDWAQQKYAAAVAANPLSYRTPAQKFHDTLLAVRTRLDGMRAWMTANPTRVTVDDRTRYLAIQTQYNALAAGFYAGATAADGKPAVVTPLQYTPVVGVAPAVVVVIVIGVAVVAVAIAAVAWAIATQPYADSLLVQANTAQRELEARDAASRDGRTLQPSTLPQPKDGGPGLLDTFKNLPLPVLMPAVGGLLLVAWLTVQATTGRR